MMVFWIRLVLVWLVLFLWLFLYRRMSLSVKPNGEGVGEVIFYRLPDPIKSYRWSRKKSWLTIIHGSPRGEEVLVEREKGKWRDLYLLAGWISPALLFPPIFPLLLALSIGRWFYEEYSLSKKAKQIQREVLGSLPEMISRLLLSIQAGALVKDAWLETGLSQEGVLYEEMRKLTEDIEQGVSLAESYRNFGRHLQIPVLGDIGQLMVEGLHLGSQQLVKELETIRSRQVQEEKRRIMEEADRASQQMIFPSILLFIGILILIMAPMLAQGMI